MGKNCLVDTNTAIEYIGEVLPQKVLNQIDKIINGIFYISIINKIELLGFAGITPDEERKFQDIIDAATVLNLTDDVVNKTIELRKANKIKLPDAIIAATALINNLTLISRNTADFKNIEGLVVVNPWEL